MSHLISDLSMIAIFFYLATYINGYLNPNSFNYIFIHLFNCTIGHMFQVGQDTYYGQCIGTVKVH